MLAKFEPPGMHPSPAEAAQAQEDYEASLAAIETTKDAASLLEARRKSALQAEIDALEQQVTAQGDAIEEKKASYLTAIDEKRAAEGADRGAEAEAASKEADLKT